MKLEKIYLQTHTKFAGAISNWVQELNVEVVDFHERNIEEVNLMDGLIIFTENQSLEREANDMRMIFDVKQKPIQKIDINGTLVVGVSNFNFWLDRNNCKSILIIGSDHIIANPNLERFLSNIKLK